MCSLGFHPSVCGVSLSPCVFASLSVSFSFSDIHVVNFESAVPPTGCTLLPSVDSVFSSSFLYALGAKPPFSCQRTSFCFLVWLDSVGFSMLHSCAACLLFHLPLPLHLSLDDSARVYKAYQSLSLCVCALTGTKQNPSPSSSYSSSHPSPPPPLDGPGQCTR